MLLPEQAGAMKKYVCHQRVVRPQSPLHQLHAACQPLHSVGPFHAALICQLYRTLHLHMGHSITVACVMQQTFSCGMLQPSCKTLHVVKLAGATCKAARTGAH